MKTPLKLLLVQNNKNDVASVISSLKLGNFEVKHQVVATKETVEDALVSNKFDLVISDSQLEKISAFDVLDIIESLKIDIPFIVVSRVVEEEEAVPLLKRGADDFITTRKLARLAPSVSRALRQSAICTESKRFESELFESEERFRAITENTPDLTFIISEKGVIEYISPAISNFKFSEKDLVGTNYYDFINPEYSFKARTTIDQAIRIPYETFFVEDVIIQSRGSTKKNTHLEQMITAMPDTIGVRGIVISCRDITARVHAEAMLRQANKQLKQLSITDPLTGLFNRRRGIEILDDEMSRVYHAKQVLSLIMLDLDHFKRVNDTRGHAAGDAVLIEVSNRLTEASRQYDMIVRWGGEEILIICPHTDSKEILSVARRFHEVVSTRPISIENQPPLNITSCLGLSSTDIFVNCSSEMLVSMADQAMYQAKNEGRNAIRSIEVNPQ